ncbi:MAG TPA: adenylosuccinate synthetase [Jatrophihabitans sp.]|uniref:adenylosuccinate synthetase n=1 Tax=Jatrophihabitans sp. TaxID=1932789 RepID=UPI002EDFA5B1
MNTVATPTALDDLSDSGLSLHGVRQIRQAQHDQTLAKLAALNIKAPAAQHVTWVGDLQQGDGGKGAMADRLGPSHQLIVRTQGGDNAGHTTVFTAGSGQNVVLKNHIVPSGLRHPGCVGVLGNGVLLNAERLADELAAFAQHVPDIDKRVLVSARAHLVLPLHRLVDGYQEDLKRQSAHEIGTTHRGIGPANVSKVNRIGIRVGDLSDMDLVEERLHANVQFFHLEPDQVRQNLEWLSGYRKLLLSLAIDSRRLINTAVSEGYSVLFEGAQGPLIDLEHGIYPYVTTSPTAVYSVCSGSGVDLSKVTRRVGVLKLYQTMVGNGAFVSEDHGELGERLRRVGEEVGTTTGRPRRCGWLDLVHAHWAVGLNQYTSVVLTKLDVLDDFDEIGVCVAYQRDGEILAHFEPEHRVLTQCTPIYRYFKGWKCSTRELDSYSELPERARQLIDFVGEYLGVDISGVTKGPRDSDILVPAASELIPMLAGPARAGSDRAG